MTVKDLKKQLEQFSDDDIVVISKDGEGNSFSPLADIDEDMYVADSTWSGEIYPREFDKDYFDDRAQYKEVKAEAKNCVTLWPTN